MRHAYTCFTLILLLLLTLGCPKGQDSSPSDSNENNPQIIIFSPQDFETFQQKNAFLLAQEHVRNKDLNNLKRIINKLPDINMKGALGNGLIHYAVQQGNKTIINYLIAKGADPNLRSIFQRTPLHYAASQGKEEIVKLLINAGADVTSQTKDHLGIIHTAVIGDLLQLVKLCLKKGVDINLKFRGLYPPLYYAIIHERSRLISMLQAAGVDIYASETIAQAAAQKNNTILLKQILLRKRGEISSSTKNNLLHTAAQKGHLSTVKLLLKSGADINSKDPHHPGEGLLHSAARSGNVRLVEFLFQKGIPVNHDDQMGREDIGISPFNLALSLGKNELVHLFKSKGYQINYDPYTMAWAIEGGLTRFVQECLLKGVSLKKTVSADPSLPHQTAAAGQKEMMTLLLKNGVRVNSRDWNGKTPLHWAASYKNREMVDFLLANGADINAQDKKGETPLHTSITYKHTDTIRFLLKRGAKPGIANKRLQTPLFIAVRASLKSNAMLLLAGDYNLAAPTTSGDNLLHAAVMGVWPELIEFLVVNKKMDINLANNHGITPLHLAARGGNEALIRLLLKLGANKNAADRNGKTPADYLKNNTSPSLRTLLLND